MQVLKIILTIIYFIVCLAVIVITMMQWKEDEGWSSTITGSSANNFYEKNKGNTREGKLKRWTMIFGLVLVLLCIGLGTIYVL